jgi:hypothetical protein
MNRFDFYKNAYETEIDRRKSIESGLKLPISLISGLIAWQFYLYAKCDFHFHWYCWVKLWLFLSLLTLFASITCLAISYFFISIGRKRPYIDSAYPYEYLEDINEYEAFYKGRVTHNHESNLQSPISNNELEEYIIGDLLTYTGKNIKVNDKKVAWLNRANVFLVATLIFNGLLCYDIFARV